MEDLAQGWRTRLADSSPRVVLSDITLSSSRTFAALTGRTPPVLAMLS